MGENPTIFEAAKPPPHWTAGPTRYEHPSEVGQWDWMNDPVGGRRDLAIKRLNWSRDHADPRAPDQMALVLRLDLGVTLGDLQTQTARVGAWKRHAERSDARIAALEGAIREACDLLMEKTHGSPARSPGHNARLCLQSSLTASPEAQTDG